MGGDQALACLLGFTVSVCACIIPASLNLSHLTQFFNFGTFDFDLLDAREARYISIFRANILFRFVSCGGGIIGRGRAGYKKRSGRGG